MLSTTANKITVLRILLVPVFLALMISDRYIAAFIVYAAACLSDMLDGYIARHYHQISVFGKFMDPLADKILVLSAMCMFIEKGQMSAWCVALVLLREFAVSGLRLLAAQQQIVIAAAWSGKIKTAATMVCLAAMLLFPGISEVSEIGSAVIVLTTLFSGAEYFVKNKKVLES